MYLNKVGKKPRLHLSTVQSKAGSERLDTGVMELGARGLDADPWTRSRPAFLGQQVALFAGVGDLPLGVTREGCDLGCTGESLWAPSQSPLQSLRTGKAIKPYSIPNVLKCLCGAGTSGPPHLSGPQFPHLQVIKLPGYDSLLLRNPLGIPGLLDPFHSSSVSEPLHGLPVLSPKLRTLPLPGSPLSPSHSPLPLCH